MKVTIKKKEGMWISPNKLLATGFADQNLSSAMKRSYFTVNYDFCPSIFGWVLMNESNKTKLAIASLFFGVVAISFSSIFIRWSSAELSSNATVFNRFWFSGVVFGLWQGGKAIGQRLSFDKPVQQQFYTSQELLLLLGAGTCWAATVGFLTLPALKRRGFQRLLFGFPLSTSWLAWRSCLTQVLVSLSRGVSSDVTHLTTQVKTVLVVARLSKKHWVLGLMFANIADILKTGIGTQHGTYLKKH